MKASASVRTLLLNQWRNNTAVQLEASFESMRRILVTFWIFLPVLLVLVVWYAHLAPTQVATNASWAHSLMLVNGITAMVTLVLGVVVTLVLRHHAKGGWTTLVLQVLMCATYLAYGLALLWFDVAVGGVSAFILVSFAVAGLSLMRPLVSVLLFGTAAVALWVILECTGVTGASLAILRLNGLASLGLSAVVATIIFSQYRKGLLMRRTLEAMADNDPLTGLANRRKLTSRLELALAQSERSGQYGAVLFLDLDHFKNVNDSRGHHCGDLLLQRAAQRLVGGVREVDLVARMGGDEFVVLLEDLGPDAGTAQQRANAVAQTLLDRLGQPYFADTIDLTTTASIGGTTFHGQGLPFDELLNRADEALYQAKEAGRNTVRFRGPEP